GASKASRTRPPLTSTTVRVMPLPRTTFSPGFLLRTSMVLLREADSGGWKRRHKRGAFGALLFCHSGLRLQLGHRHRHRAADLDLGGAGGIRRGAALALVAVALRLG